MTDLLNYRTTRQYFQDLDRRMEKAGVSQNQLADESGFTSNEISRWRNGHVKNPRPDKILQLEHALNRLSKKKRK